MKTIAISDTPLLGALMCLGYRPESLQRNTKETKRVEFVFSETKQIIKDIESIKSGKKKFSAYDLAIELHSVRAKIKNYSSIN